MYRKVKAEFKICVESAIWNYLDKLAAKIDQHYVKLGKQKRKQIKAKKGRPNDNASSVF